MAPAGNLPPFRRSLHGAAARNAARAARAATAKMRDRPSILRVVPATAIQPAATRVHFPDAVPGETEDRFRASWRVCAAGEMKATARAAQMRPAGECLARKRLAYLAQEYRRAPMRLFPRPLRAHARETRMAAAVPLSAVAGRTAEAWVCAAVHCSRAEYAAKKRTAGRPGTLEKKQVLAVRPACAPPTAAAPYAVRQERLPFRFSGSRPRARAARA